MIHQSEERWEAKWKAKFETSAEPPNQKMREVSDKGDKRTNEDEDRKLGQEEVYYEKTSDEGPRVT